MRRLLFTLSLLAFVIVGCDSKSVYPGKEDELKYEKIDTGRVIKEIEPAPRGDVYIIFEDEPTAVYYYFF